MQQQLLHHHTTQVAGNQVQPAVAHMHASGIHQHKTWHTAPTIRAVHRQAAVEAAAAALPLPQLPQNHPATQHSEEIQM